MQKEQTVLHFSFVPNEDWLMFFIPEIQSTKQFQEFLTNQEFNVNSRFFVSAASWETNEVRFGAKWRSI
jgi:hypothetical protein